MSKELGIHWLPSSLPVSLYLLRACRKLGRVPASRSKMAFSSNLSTPTAESKRLLCQFFTRQCHAGLLLLSNDVGPHKAYSFAWLGPPTR